MQTSNLFQPALVPRQKDVFLQVQFAWQPHRKAQCQCRRLGIHDLPPLTLVSVCDCLALHVGISEWDADIFQVLYKSRGSSRDHQMKQPHKQGAFSSMKAIPLLMIMKDIIFKHTPWQ